MSAVRSVANTFDVTLDAAAIIARINSQSAFKGSAKCIRAFKTDGFTNTFDTTVSDGKPAARLDHTAAVALVDRERLLAQHVHPGARRAQRVVEVLVVRQRDVDRIHISAAKACVVLFVRMRGDVVFARERLALGGIARHDRHEARVAPRVGESGQHRSLRDVALPDHRIADRGSRLRAGWHNWTLRLKKLPRTRSSVCQRVPIRLSAIRAGGANLAGAFRSKRILDSRASS